MLVPMEEIDVMAKSSDSSRTNHVSKPKPKIRNRREHAVTNQAKAEHNLVSAVEASKAAVSDQVEAAGKVDLRRQQDEIVAFAIEKQAEVTQRNAEALVKDFLPGVVGMIHERHNALEAAHVECMTVDEEDVIDADWSDVVGSLPSIEVEEDSPFAALSDAFSLGGTSPVEVKRLKGTQEVSREPSPFDALELPE